jgi:secreted protein with Ig-like and vWFA domain
MKTSDGPEMLAYAPETKHGMALIPPAHVAIDAPTFTRGVMIELGASATATGTTAVSASAPASRQSKVADAPPDERNFSDHRQSPAEPSPPPSKEAYRETYAPITENPLTQATQQPLSTFSIDVDTAAYANVRRFLNSGSAPPVDAVRIEEFINYFPYDYEFPQRGEAPFTVAAAVAEAPWQPTHRLARIAIKARDVGMDRRQSNFVFLVDVSGSMDEPNKLPLVQQSLSLLTDQLTAEDRVAIVVYAGNSGLALSSTSGDQKDTLRQAIRQMKSGGSTHGSAGIRQAYEEAQKNFIKEGVNRVILCTDGDFNVGTTSPEELEKLIAEKAKDGVFLSVLGYGTGNTQDRTMETLADKGNGNYAYIDSLSEARKVLVDQMRGTLITVAKDVKIQVEFNPTLVQSYRLIGYENRLLAKEDFNNDAKDAGEIGAGHTVTALYEIVPVGITNPDGRPLVDPLKYQSAPTASPSDAAKTGEMMTVKLRYKKPEGEKSDLLEFPVRDENKNLRDSDPEFRFATAVASFGLLLRNSSYRGELTWEQVRQLALGAKGQDTNGHRGEFIQLIDKARGILGEGRP